MAFSGGMPLVKARGHSARSLQLCRRPDVLLLPAGLRRSPAGRRVLQQAQGVSSGETPDSERARALELAKLSYDPSPRIDGIGPQSRAQAEATAPGETEERKSSAEDGPAGVSSGETPDSEKARALELAKLDYDPSPTLDGIDQT